MNFVFCKNSVMDVFYRARILGVLFVVLLFLGRGRGGVGVRGGVTPGFRVVMMLYK